MLGASSHSFCAGTLDCVASILFKKCYHFVAWASCGYENFKCDYMGQMGNRAESVSRGKLASRKRFLLGAWVFIPGNDSYSDRAIYFLLKEAGSIWINESA